MGIRRAAPFAAGCCVLASAIVVTAAFAQAPATAPAGKTGPALRVCADPNSMPQSDNAGAGYENKLAEALARDLGRHVEYTFFPQRMGFVRNTLRARDDDTQQFKCDLIIGVPKGYDLTANTRSYMRSTYALVVPARDEFKNLKTAEDLMKLPKEKLQSLRYGMFAQTPATDWLLRNGLIERATMYTAQSGDPNEHPANIIERDLEAGKIDLAIVWGPVAGFLADRHKGGTAWLAVPFAPDPQIRFDYEMAMGVRFGETEWRNTVDQWIAGHQPEINKILVGYHVPLLDVPPPAKPSGAN